MGRKLVHIDTMPSDFIRCLYAMSTLKCKQTGDEASESYSRACRKCESLPLPVETSTWFSVELILGKAHYTAVEGGERGERDTMETLGWIESVGLIKFD